jgi:hypothetical protein
MTHHAHMQGGGQEDEAFDRPPECRLISFSAEFSTFPTADQWLASVVR